MNKQNIITVLRGFAIPVLALFWTAGLAQEQTDSTKTKERGLMLFAEVKDHITHEAIKGVRGELLHAANARLAKRMMKGNMTIIFDGFDLLGNLSNVRRTINAQGRTETFYNVIPSYGLLHITYRLNKEPKKK